MEAFKARFTHFSYARHSHESYALGVVEQGAMRFWHRGAEHVAADGELIAINPGEVHDGRTASQAGCRYRMLYVECSAIDQVFGEESGRTRALKSPVLRNRRLASLACRVHRGLESPRADALEQHARLAQLLFQLFGTYGLPPLSAQDIGNTTRVVALAKDYMAAHLDEPVLLRDLASMAGLSPFHFLRCFKRATGMPPHAYLTQLRLQRARALLRATEPPAQVAAALGFADQSHLTRRFKAAFGVTPSQYQAAT